MARSDWAAFLTEPAAEYLARTELERFGLSPYLPQLRRRFVNNGAVCSRLYPLFPRYFLLPHKDLTHPGIRSARVRMTLLASPSGTPWRAADAEIRRLIEAEHNGAFDEGFAPGQDVMVGRITAVISRTLSAQTLELFTPLLGGARAVVKVEKVRHNS